MSSPDERGFTPSLPDWLKADKPSASLSAVSVPDWLSAEKPNRSLVAASLPEWLGGGAQASSKKPTESTSPIPEPSVPDESAPDISISDFRRQMSTAEMELEVLLGSTLGGSSEASRNDEFEDLLAASPLPTTDSGSLERDVTPLEIPDWLGRSEPSPAAKEEAQPFGGVPDWLSDATAEEGSIETKPEPSIKDIPDWLNESASPMPADKDNELLSDWLSDAAPPPPGGAADDAPEWIKSAEAAAPSELETSKPVDSAEPEKPLETAEEIQPSTGMVDLISDLSPSSAPEPSSADSTPDWLSAMAAPEFDKSTGSAPVPVESSAPVSADAPDWLNALAESGTTTPSIPSDQPAQASPASGDSPDWLNAFAEGGTAKPSEPVMPAASQPPQTSSAPDWLESAASGQPAGAAPTLDVPDWLNAAVSATPEVAVPGSPPPAEAPTPEVEEEKSDSLLEWMQSPEFGFAPPPAAPIEGEDLLGLSMDLAAPSGEQTGEEDTSAIPGELPEWLRGFKPTSDASEPISSELAQGNVSPELISQLSDLRYDVILGDLSPDAAANVEKVGALKDVTGAIKPELIFDAQSLKVGGLVSDTVLSKEQGRRLELLGDLLSERGQELSIPGKGRAALPFVRWLLTLAVLAAVAAPIIGGLKLIPLSPGRNAGPTAVHDTIAGLPKESHVVMAFEYGPDTAGEMEPIASAVIDDLAVQTGSVVYMVSTRPTGPSMAERSIKALEETSGETPEGWVNLGYIPGGSNGISALTLGAPAGMISPFGQDYRNQPTGMTATSLNGLKPDLIVVISDQPEDLRNWIEQASGPAGIPLVAATSASVAPMVGPYTQSGQIAALMSGYNDAVAYRSLSEQPLSESQTLIWQGQALGSLVAAAVILVAGVIYGFISLRELREQAS